MGRHRDAANVTTTEHWDDVLGNSSSRDSCPGSIFTIQIELVSCPHWCQSICLGNMIFSKCNAMANSNCLWLHLCQCLCIKKTTVLLNFHDFSTHKLYLVQKHMVKHRCKKYQYDPTHCDIVEVNLVSGIAFTLAAFQTLGSHGPIQAKGNYKHVQTPIDVYSYEHAPIYVCNMTCILYIL